MLRLRSLMFRLRKLFTRKQAEIELSDEVRAHLELATEAKIAAGMTPDEARVSAKRDLGGIEQIKEACRDERGFVWLDQFMQDWRGAVRMLRKNPAFTVITVAIIALGIGATTAIFSIVNSVILRPLPYPDSGRLVVIHETFPPRSYSSPVSSGTYFEWKSQATMFADMAAAEYWPCNLTAAGTASRRTGRMVSSGFFPTYGVSPVLGRDFLPEEHDPGRDAVVILNYKLWVSIFNSDPGIINRKIKINDRIYTIVGVLPKTFLPETMTDPGLFSPLVFTAQDRTDHQSHALVDVIGRLKPGISLEAASGELAVIAARLALQYPATNRGWGVRLTPLLETKIGEVRPFLLLLLGAVTLLLLIACVNVANLLLARASSRQKELAVRTALGASRGRVIRQLLVESLLVSCLGGVLGTLLAYASLDALLGLGPLALPRSKEIAIDGDALWFTLGLTLLTGIGFGVLPALRASRVNLSDVMKEGGRGSGEGAGGHRLRALLVIFEVSLALVLLTGAGLLMNSFIRLQQVPLGFHLGSTEFCKVLMIQERYPTADKQLTFVDQALERLSAVHGVEALAFSTNAPALGLRNLRAVAIAGHADLNPWEQPPVSYYVATPDYFKVIGLPLLRGRLFDRHDSAAAPPVVVVSDDFAAKYFPNGDALGKRINVLTGPGAIWREIIGIVPAVKESGPAVATPFQAYEPFAQRPTPVTNILIRVDETVPEIDVALRAAMDTIDPDMPMPVGSELNQFLRDTTSAQRFSLFLFAVFSSSALVLSAMGIYGVVSYSVAQRTQEIGIRLALGAQARDILRLIFARAGLVVGLGLILGLAGALACTSLLNSLLYEVNSHDPSTVIMVTLVLGGVALLACWLPARRATKVDPMIALRTE